MFVRIRNARGKLGLTVGLVFGLLLAGYWPNTPLHAVSTDRVDSFAVATGYCDDSVEAIYFLDFLTGKLRATVVSKQNGKFNAFFVHDVGRDFEVDPAKNPRYLLVTGSADLRRTGGKGLSPSKSLVYVAELTTGKVAAYSIPWSSSAWVAGQHMEGDFILMDVTRFASGAPKVRESE